MTSGTVLSQKGEREEKYMHQKVSRHIDLFDVAKAAAQAQIKHLRLDMG